MTFVQEIESIIYSLWQLGGCPIVLTGTDGLSNFSPTQLGAEGL
jgi:hypothetical protein